MAVFQLADLLEGVADKRGDAVAIICGQQQLSFSELDSRASQLAHGFLSQGIKAGDHVGLYMSNCTEFVESLFACYKIGVAPININYRYVDDELRYLFTNADMKAVVFQQQYLPQVMAVAPDCEKLQTLIQLTESGSTTDDNVVDYHSLLNAANPERDFGERDEQDLYILYTGGTTGMPKGVMWPHRNLFFRALGGGGIMGEGPVSTPEELFDRANGGMVTLLGSPLMHGASQWSCLMMLLGGSTIVLSDRANFDPDAMWSLVEKHSVNSLSIVGDAMARPLIESLEAQRERGEACEYPSLFVVGSGGALFSVSAQDRLKELLPNIMIFNGFGSSESGVHGRSEKTNEDGLIEIEVTATTALINDESEIISADSRELGVIAFCGNTPVGYYNDPEKSAETFITIGDTLWIMTGDRGRYTDSGSITMMGRDSGCINTGGEKVFAEEVESIVKTHPAVYDCLVVGVPDDRFGNRVVALAQLREGESLELDELKNHCSQSLSGYKVPRLLIAVDKIQREPNGKPNYRWAKATANANA